MFDLTNLLPIASKMMGLNQQQQQNLNSAITKAKEILNANTSSPLEALRQAGVSKEFINRLSANLNNPMAQSLLGLLGLDKNDVSGKLNQLTNDTPIFTDASEKVQDTEVDKYRRALTRL